MKEPSFIFCQLSAESVPQLYEIELECNRPPWSVALLRAEFSQPHARVFGVRSGGIIVGFLILHTVIDEAHILNVGVRSSFRGRGAGRVLLEEVCARLREEAARVVTLEVRVSNSVAQSLYESLGFVKAGTRPRYYADNGEDALTMRLEL